MVETYNRKKAFITTSEKIKLILTSNCALPISKQSISEFKFFDNLKINLQDENIKDWLGA